MSNELYKLFTSLKKTHQSQDYPVSLTSLSPPHHLVHNNTFAHIKINHLNNVYKINDNNVTVFIITNKLDKKLFNRIINRIINFKNFSKNQDPLVTYIWLSNEKKKFPKRGVVLGPQHVNSGSTYVQLNKNNDIHIWRKDEVLKVLLHEMLHSFGYDYHALDNQLDDLVKDKFNINHYISANESYTETLATILNAMYYTIDHDRDYGYFLVLLKNEQNHALTQVGNILHHYKYHNSGELLRKYSDRKFPQKTGVFSYYILKAMVLNNVLEFMRFSMKNNLRYPENGHQRYFKIIKEDVLNMSKLKNNKKSLNMTITC